MNLVYKLLTNEIYLDDLDLLSEDLRERVVNHIIGFNIRDISKKTTQELHDRFTEASYLAITAIAQGTNNPELLREMLSCAALSIQEYIVWNPHCPSTLLEDVDLGNPNVRFALAYHNNTPMYILKSFINDECSMVRGATRLRFKKRRTSLWRCKSNDRRLNRNLKNLAKRVL